MDYSESEQMQASKHRQKKSAHFGGDQDNQEEELDFTEPPTDVLASAEDNNDRSSWNNTDQ